jgi:hypothetical protein
VQAAFVVIDYEIFSMVIRTEPLFWHVQKFQFLAKVKVFSTVKLLNSRDSRNDAVAELCPGQFNVA